MPSVQFGKAGEKFNPSMHESIEIVDTDDQSKDDIIESILSNGYKFDDNILRPARVKVWNMK